MRRDKGTRMAMEEALRAEIEARPARIVRAFGWVTLTVLAAFLINNVLVVGFDYPTITAIGEGGGAYTLAFVYVAAVALGLAFVHLTGDRSLRSDARMIHNFNVYLIRALFFAVLFVGVADAGIAFLRVEGLLDVYFNEQLAKDLIRSHFIGPNIHVPLIVLGFIVAIFSRTLGFHWLALLIVVAELAIVISRFVFSYEQALMGDLVRYWYAALFLFSSAYTLFDEGHVRVDVLYSGFGPTTKGISNTLGTLLLGMTTCWVIIVVAMGTKQSIVNSPVANFEVSQTGTAGMYIKYQMAAFLAIFAVTMLIQFVSYFFEAVADWRGEPGKREIAPVSH